MIRDKNDRQLLERLRGMTVALATPLKHDGGVDCDALERLIGRVVDQGAAAVFPLGWMGEQPALPAKSRRQVIEEVVRVVGGRVPVICGISEQSLPRVIAEADVARAAGADVLLATPPFSYPLTGGLILDYFERLTSVSRMPVILYNNSEAHKPLGLAEIEKAGRIPGLIGIKDFSDFVLLERLLANIHHEDEFIVWVAEEYFLGPALFLGARYSMLGGPGNLAGDWGVRMHRCAEGGKWGEVAQLHNRLIAFCDALYSLADSPYSTVKAALGILGFGAGNAIPPLPTLDPEQVERVRKVLAQFDVR